MDLPLAGKFRRIQEEKPDGTAAQYAFMPHLDFVGSGNFSFQENQFNISPLSKGAAGFQSNILTVSLSSISAVINIDREATVHFLKQIFVKFVSINCDDL